MDSRRQQPPWLVREQMDCFLHDGYVSSVVAIASDTLWKRLAEPHVI